MPRVIHPSRQYHPVNEQGEDEDPVEGMTRAQIDGFAKAMVDHFRAEEAQTKGVLTEETK